MASRTGPKYTIARDSAAFTDSMYSEDFDRLYRDSTLPDVPPLSIQKPISPEHAHPQQRVLDHGQKVRTSRLPLFNQVRSMLHKPPLANGRPVNVKWDEFSGEISADGKAPQVRPSNYKGSHDDVSEVRHKPRYTLSTLADSRSLSPVSTLREDEWDTTAPLPMKNAAHRSDSPVSFESVSPIDTEMTRRIPLTRPKPIMVETPTPAQKAIKRKPVSSDKGSVPRNVSAPDSSPLQMKGPFQPEMIAASPERKSRFSWTTYDPSVAPARPSIDTVDSSYGHGQAQAPLRSRFSWSTWNTANTPQLRSDSPPPSPPPPLPRKYATPPVQSILSRARPIQRADREERIPPPPAMSTQVKPVKGVATTQTPTSAKHGRVHEDLSASSAGRSSMVKKLPLPPELQAKSANMSHLEALLRQQADLEHQRRNTERLISENLKMQKASPMQVSSAGLKHAQRRLAEHQQTLQEIKLEEFQIGIAVSRARKKEGVEEGLWVRRVTS